MQKVELLEPGVEKGCCQQVRHALLVEALQVLGLLELHVFSEPFADALEKEFQVVTR